jgi:maltose phosphorylase
MAGTWMSIVEGFGGVRVKNNELHINPKLPEKWKKYSFKINFRGTLIKVQKTKYGTKITHDNIELNVFCEDKLI